METIYILEVWMEGYADKTAYYFRDRDAAVDFATQLYFSFTHALEDDDSRKEVRDLLNVDGSFEDMGYKCELFQDVLR